MRAVQIPVGLHERLQKMVAQGKGESVEALVIAALVRQEVLYSLNPAAPDARRPIRLWSVALSALACALPCVVFGVPILHLAQIQITVAPVLLLLFGGLICGTLIGIDSEQKRAAGRYD